MTTKGIRPAHRVYWVALRDGIAHAQRQSTGSRTACGKAGINERYGWTRTSTCPACVEALAAEEVAIVRPS